MMLDEGQLDALDRLKNGSILVGGVGSGKSRTGLAYYFMKECGGSLSINKKGHYRKMTDPKDLIIITTAKKRDEKEWEKELTDFILSKDDKTVSIKIDSWQNLPKYTNTFNSFFIFDEQRLVGNGKWVKSFLRIAKNNHWILLSATPADKWEDLIPVFIANGFYKNRTEFNEKHIIFDRFSKWPRVKKYINTGRLIKLRECIYVDMNYKKETIHNNINVFAGFNKDDYNTIFVKRWNIYDNAPIENISKVCYLLRRVVNSDPSRLEAVKDILRDHPKAIIFYNFDYELELLRDLAKEIGIHKAEWNGHIHQPVPTYDKWIYLVQYTAGAEGWNCITTNTIIFFSQNYSYKTMVQAAGRIDRRNTTYRDLYYYHIKSKSQIDMAISRSLKSKKTFNERTFLGI